MKRGIALSGGGTKGSYEVGVWKALNELGIDYQIVTGTSIGSINGAFMACRDYERAYELWDTIKMENMMEDGINLTETIEGMLEQKEAIRPFLKKYVKNKGADISPFSQFIEQMIDEQTLRKSDVDYGLVTVQFPSMKEYELTKKDIPDGMLKDYILASAAIFPLFPMHKIGEDTYVDGCYHDNLPIDLAISMGAQEVVAVDLRLVAAHPNYAKRPYVKYIKPSRSLGTMMNFDHTLLMENMKMGYQDTMKSYGKYKGFYFTFMQDTFSSFQREIEAFSDAVARAEALLSETRFRKFVKPGDVKNLFDELEDGTNGRRLSKEDYFVRGAELLGIVFHMDAGKTYGFSSYIKELKGSVMDRALCTDTEFFLKKNRGSILSKLAGWKLGRESDYITSCIFYAICEKKIDRMEQIGLLTILPKELIGATFLNIVMEHEKG